MSTPPSSIALLPLGGLGEFGMNCMVYAFGDTRFMVDCGVMFPQPEHIGVDFLVPCFDVLEDAPPQALVLTHAHEDHIGAVPYFVRWRHAAGHTKPCPIYATRFTLELVRRRLDEHEAGGMVDLRLIGPSEKVTIGSGHSEVEVEFIHVNHSIPGAVALAIGTSVGTVVHTGDWRIDHEPVNEPFIDLARFAALGSEGVLALLGDSTNTSSEGSSASESDVRRELEDVFDLAPGRVIITQFSSNIWRLQSILHAAHVTGRRVLLIGRSLVRNAGIARETGHLRLPGPDVLIDPPALDRLPDEEVVIVAGGSQGEPYSSLTRMAFGEHNLVGFKPGDWMIYSSRQIPGNEKRIGQVMDELFRRGVEVLVPGKRKLHTTGHAYRDELKLLLALLKPRHFIPIHGDYRQLHRHAELARTQGVSSVVTVSNGERVRFDESGIQVEAYLDVPPSYAAGGAVDLIDDEVLRLRRQVGYAGVIIANVLLDHRGAFLDVAITSLAVTGEEEELVEELQHVVKTVMVDSLSDDDDGRAEEVRLAVRRHARVRTERKPVVVVNIMRLEH